MEQRRTLGQRQAQTRRAVQGRDACRPRCRVPAGAEDPLGVASVALAGLDGLLLFLAFGADDEPARSAQQTSASATASAAGPGRQATAADAAEPGPGQPSGPDPDRSAVGQLDPTSEDPRVIRALEALATDEDRVGQLFLHGWIGERAEDARRTIRELRPGGIVHIANARARADAVAINTGLAEIARESGGLPLLIAVDHEGGEVQRIADVPNVGTNRDFASGRPSERAACERGQTHAQQLRAMGFSMNLAPVLDVNNNPNNPVIGDRSYGDDPALVARLGSAYIRGLQGAGVAAVGKHFPGHGNTGVDSHLDLPILPQDEEALERVELVPFRRAIAPDTDVAGIMSAHIVFPSLDPTGTPSTLSRPVMTGLLRDKLGFRGLAVSDDLGAMKAITDNFSPGEAAVRSVRAGVDLLIIGGDLARQRQSRDAVLTALSSGELGHDRLDEAIRRVLRVKARFGLLGGPAAEEVGCA